MSTKSLGKIIIIIMILGLTLGGMTYGVNMMNIVSQLKADSLESLDQLQETQRQFSELSEDFQLLQESYENQLNSSGPRYTGNPFATELWPGQLQSENITGMHWYSYYEGALVNCTDNVLGLGGEVELEGEYTAWTLVWTGDHGVDVELSGILVDNYGTCYITDMYDNHIFLRTYEGVETNLTEYVYNVPRVLGSPEAYSMTHKYVLGENKNVWQQFDIWRYGVLIASINPEVDYPDTSTYWAKWMSPNGKFIAFVLNSNGSGNARYSMLYEGS